MNNLYWFLLKDDDGEEKRVFILGDSLTETYTAMEHMIESPIFSGVDFLITECRIVAINQAGIDCRLDNNIEIFISREKDNKQCPPHLQSP